MAPKRKGDRVWQKCQHVACRAQRACMGCREGSGLLCQCGHHRNFHVPSRPNILLGGVCQEGDFCGCQEYLESETEDSHCAACTHFENEHICSHAFVTDLRGEVLAFQTPVKLETVQKELGCAYSVCSEIGSILTNPTVLLEPGVRYSVRDSGYGALSLAAQQVLHLPPHSLVKHTDASMWGAYLKLRHEMNLPTLVPLELQPEVNRVIAEVLKEDGPLRKDLEAITMEALLTEKHADHRGACYTGLGDVMRILQRARNAAQTNFVIGNEPTLHYKNTDGSKTAEGRVDLGFLHRQILSLRKTWEALLGGAEVKGLAFGATWLQHTRTQLLTRAFWKELIRLEKHMKSIVALPDAQVERETVKFLGVSFNSRTVECLDVETVIERGQICDRVWRTVAADDLFDEDGKVVLKSVALHELAGIIVRLDDAVLRGAGERNESVDFSGGSVSAVRSPDLATPSVSEQRGDEAACMSCPEMPPPGAPESWPTKTSAEGLETERLESGSLPIPPQLLSLQDVAGTSPPFRSSSQTFSQPMEEGIASLTEVHSRVCSEAFHLGPEVQPELKSQALFSTEGLAWDVSSGAAEAPPVEPLALDSAVRVFGEDGRVREFYTRAILARSGRAVVYRVEDSGQSAPLILRHGPWSQSGASTVFLNTHAAALSLLDGQLSHPKLVCKGYLDSHRRGVTLRAPAIVETWEGDSLMSNGKVQKLSPYELCKAGADILEQLKLHQMLNLIQRDMTPANLVRRRTSRLRKQLSGFSISASTPESTHATVTHSSGVQALAEATPSSLAMQSDPWDCKFSIVDFDYASLSSASSATLLPVLLPLVSNPLFQPHLLGSNRMLRTEDSVLALMFSLAALWGGTEALPWADAEDLEAVQGALQMAMGDPLQLFGLNGVCPEVGAFAAAVKAAAVSGSSVSLDAWSRRLHEAADTIAQSDSPGQGSRSPAKVERREVAAKVPSSQL